MTEIDRIFEESKQRMDAIYDKALSDFKQEVGQVNRKATRIVVCVWIISAAVMTWALMAGK